MIARPVEVVAGATVSFLSGVFYQRFVAQSGPPTAATRDSRAEERCWSLLEQRERPEVPTSTAAWLLACLVTLAFGWSLALRAAGVPWGGWIGSGGGGRRTAAPPAAPEVYSIATPRTPHATQVAAVADVAPREGDPALDVYVPRRR